MVLLANMGRCVYCDRDSSAEVDHVVPLSANGADDRRNLVPACRECNLGKSDKGLFVWVAELAYRERAKECGASPHGPNGLVWMRDYIDSAFDGVQARIEAVKAELDDEARSTWFFDRYWWLGKNDPVWLWRAWVEPSAAEARAKGYPKLPPPPRMRITRSRLGQLLEPVPPDETP
ncbi:HNH endonuclease [Streptomyces sp. NBC_00467]|uniref:HNH endonuclease n=1 Tax=Streptomyces sp. NBC_00467 TaxID=2975752 RepID=UPI002E174043